MLVERYLTEKLLKEHQCESKNCPKLEKYEDAEYWKAKEKSKSNRLKKKQSQPIDYSEFKKTAFNTAVELTKDIENCKILRAEMMKGALIKISFVSLKYIDMTDVISELRKTLNYGVYMRRVKLPVDKQLEIFGLKDERTKYNMELETIHKASSNNAPEISISDKCGCFYCERIFSADEITDYIQDTFGTALCPYCGIDSVLPDSGDYELTEDLLKRMNKYWF